MTARAAKAVEEYKWFVENDIIKDKEFTDDVESLTEYQYRLLAAYYYIGGFVHQDLYKAMEYFKMGNDSAKVEEIENTISEYSTQINNTYSGSDRAMELYHKACKRFEEGEPDESLVNARKSLEVIVQMLGKVNSINFDTRENKLKEMIITLTESNIISAAEADLMHKTRTATNKGAHENFGGTPATMDEAKTGLSLLSEVIRIFDLESGDRLSTVTITQSDPIGFEDYYSRSRIYYGKWSRCYSRGELLQVPEYIALEQKADGGDIEAMLNIASGFLSEKNRISEAGMVSFPLYTYKDNTYNANSWDLRYYYWIVRACNEISNKINAYKKFLVPMKYVPTALLEGLKIYYFYYFHKYYDFVKNTYTQKGQICVNEISRDSMISDMFGRSMGDLFDEQDPLYTWRGVLYGLLIEYRGQTIIHPVHKEKTLHDLEVITRCIYFETNTKSTEAWSGSPYSEINNEEELQTYLKAEYENSGSLIAKDLLNERQHDTEDKKAEENKAFKKKLMIFIPIILIVLIILENISFGGLVIVLLLAAAAFFVLKVLGGGKKKDDNDSSNS